MEKTQLPAKTFSHPRYISQQQTLPASKNLMEAVKANSKDDLNLVTTVLEEEGKLLNTYALGIEASPLRFKLIKAIQKILYDKSRLYNQQNKTLSGSAHTYAISRLPDNSTKEDGFETRYPSIAISPHKFCQTVLGGRKPSKDEKLRILTELYRLDGGKFALTNEKNNAISIQQILEVSWVWDDGDSTLWIELKPMFAKVAGAPYVRERSDILTLLSDVSKSMTLLLYELLIMAWSRNLSTYYRKKSDVLSIIARGPFYESHPKNREEDFQYSIAVMKRIKLISDYREDAGICSFFFNKNHLAEERATESGENRNDEEKG